MRSKRAPFSANVLDIAQMIEGHLMKRSTGAIFVVAVSLLAGCTPLNMTDTHITGTPKPQSFDVAERVAVLGLIAPVSLQGFAPLLSNALETALEQARPPIRAISFQETGNLLNDQGIGCGLRRSSHRLCSLWHSGTSAVGADWKRRSAPGMYYCRVSPSSTRRLLTDSRLWVLKSSGTGSLPCVCGCSSGTQRRDIIFGNRLGRLPLLPRS